MWARSCQGKRRKETKEIPDNAESCPSSGTEPHPSWHVGNWLCPSPRFGRCWLEDWPTPKNRTLHGNGKPLPFPEYPFLLPKFQSQRSVGLHFRSWLVIDGSPFTRHVRRRSPSSVPSISHFQTPLSIGSHVQFCVHGAVEKQAIIRSYRSGESSSLRSNISSETFTGTWLAFVSLSLKSLKDSKYLLWLDERSRRRLQDSCFYSHQFDWSSVELNYVDSNAPFLSRTKILKEAGQLPISFVAGPAQPLATAWFFWDKWWTRARARNCFTRNTNTIKPISKICTHENQIQF